jgi:hypothetical protein
MNEIYTVTREVRDRISDAVVSSADFSELGMLLISVTVVGVCAPLLAVVLIQHSRLRTTQ